MRFGFWLPVLGLLALMWSFETSPRCRLTFDVSAESACSMESSTDKTERAWGRIGQRTIYKYDFQNVSVWKVTAKWNLMKRDTNVSCRASQPEVGWSKKIFTSLTDCTEYVVESLGKEFLCPASCVVNPKT
jgi:hypothetical protein